MTGKFSLVKRGYNTDEVDNYIAGLEKELAHHRENDLVIKNAILNAQKAAENIIQNAKNQSRIVRETAAKQLDDIVLSVNKQKEMLADFADEYTAVVSKYLKPVDNNDFRTLAEKINALDLYLKDFSDEITEDLHIAKTNTEGTV